MKNTKDKKRTNTQDMPKYLITGAGGTLGREFVRQLMDRAEVTALDNNEWALAEMKEWEGKVKLVLRDFVNAEIKNHIIIHCAAYKHVDLCEQNKDACTENNVEKTKVIHSRAMWQKKDFIFISSDKAVEPEGHYAETKKVMEDIIIASEYGKIIRLGNIYGSSGSVIPVWEKQIKEGKPLTITDLRMKRFFIDVRDAVAKILQLIPEMKNGQIGIPEMGKAITLEDLRNKVLSMHGLNKNYLCHIIGKREGEKMEEKLVGKDEKEVLSIKGIGKVYEKTNT